jgi:hypothetical protein
MRDAVGEQGWAPPIVDETLDADAQSGTIPL